MKKHEIFGKPALWSKLIISFIVSLSISELIAKLLNVTIKPAQTRAARAFYSRLN